MTALDLQTGEEVWRNSSHMVRESIGVSPDGKQVYAKLMNDSIVAVPTSDREFKTNWIIDAGIGYDHNPCPVLGTERMVIGATRNGLIVSIDPKTREVLWKFKAGNSSVNKMIFQSPNTIWFTMIEGNIMALESLL
jgi:outer membrane protein assembly factor BamB